MSKLTPIILALLMVASTSLAALEWSELEEKEMIEAEGRSGPDANVVSIIKPMATTTDAITGELRNALRAGDLVNFDVYIENSGDADITQMSVTVTVYLNDGGATGMVAKDSAGNDLSWTNGDVVCDDSFVCPWSSIAPGDTLANGKYRMSYQGSPVVWSPMTGDYIVEITVDAEGDVEIDNDYDEIPVSVADWTDIVVDLSWDSGKDVEGGNGQKAFTLDVYTDGSIEWSARNVTLSLDITGEVAEAVDDQGNDINGTGNIITDLGNNSMVETFRHAEDENNVSNGSRYVIEWGDSASWQGYVTPTGATSGDYEITVNLVSYVIYGVHPDCVEEVNNRTNGSMGNETTMTYFHNCEVEQNQDDDAATSEDELLGKVQTWHDIAIANLDVHQGYIGEEDENGAFTILSGPNMPGMKMGPLNPTWGMVQASVKHMGSDMENTYDWTVTFTIENTNTGDVHTEDANSCENGLGPSYMHQELGFNMTDPMAAAEDGEACVLYDFTPGVYNISAVISMVNSEYPDMSSSNDDMDIYEISAMNNRPTVTLTLENTDDIILGSDSGTITITASADDADDSEGRFLNYVWSHPGMDIDPDTGAAMPSMCNGLGADWSGCIIEATGAEFAGTRTYSVTVSDEFGSSATAYINIFVWNRADARVNASGFEMIYDLVFNGNDFRYTLALDDGDAITKDLTDFGYAGEYVSEAVLVYDPVTRYLGSDVHSQSISLTYDATAYSPTSVWWVSPNNLWVELDATLSETSTSGTIEITPGMDVLSQGDIVLMGGELQIISAPSASPSGLTVVATQGGDISASWGYSGSTVPGFDWLEIEVCDSSDNCNTIMENVSEVSHSMSGQTDTTHGETYTYTLQVCNVGGCNPTIATGSATADKAVDGDAVATGMSVENKDDNTWTVKWTVEGDDSDVAGWKVCWTDSSWSMAGDMPSQCTEASSSTSADIMKPGGTTKKYHFTAVPFDSLGNTKNDVSKTDITLTVDNTQEDPCVANPDLEECKNIGDGAQGSDEVPAWTWGVIIGLVVVAFVAGAFILSRGGDGDEGKDWDY